MGLGFIISCRSHTYYFLLLSHIMNFFTWFMSLFVTPLTHCSPHDPTTFVIPNASACSNGTDGNGGDEYFFGPCNTTLSDCITLLTSCMHAKGRENYCIRGDGHFCSLHDKDPFKNYLQVQCH